MGNKNSNNMESQKTKPKSNLQTDDISQQFKSLCNLQTVDTSKNFSTNDILNRPNSNQTEFIRKISKNKPEEKDLPVLSVIVTLCSDQSYDDLFNKIEQKAPEGGRVSVYSYDLNQITDLILILNNEINLAALKSETLRETISELMSEIKDLEPDCILFNFECCSGCSKQSGFPNNSETLKFIKLIIDRGNMMMFSDFAVKALISEWDNELLGKNPFINVGGCNHAISLFFDPEVLKNCPSAQLQIVGELSSNGEANIHAMSDTIVFACDPHKVDENIYTLNILTIVTKAGSFSVDKTRLQSKIKEKKGTVGHVMLTYKKSGSIMFLSSGHWVELSNLNVDITNLESVAYERGGVYQKEMEDIKFNQNISAEEKTSQFKSLANKYVQQSAPCNYSKKVDFKSKKIERMNEKNFEK